MPKHTLAIESWENLKMKNDTEDKLLEHQKSADCVAC